MTNWKYAIKYLLLMTLAVLVLGCSKKEKEEHAGEKPEMMQVTAYSERSELFMEFAEPVAGQKSPFIIKLTRLADWKPADAAPLKLVLTPASGAAVSVPVPAPARPGVYQGELSLTAPGEYALSVIYEGKGGVDRFEIPDVHVLAKGEAHKHEHDAHPEEKDAHQKGKEVEHSKEEAAGHDAGKKEHDHDEKGTKAAKPGAHPEGEVHGKADQHDEHEEGEHHEKDGHHEEGAHHEAGEHHEEGEHHGETSIIVGTGGGTITLAKEQQWTTEFLTRKPQRMNLASYFTTMGELVPVSNAEANVSSPTTGIISGTKSLPFVGQRVSKGQVVAVIEPPVIQEGGIGELSAGYAEAKNRVALAQKEYDRAKRLYEAKIAPVKRVEEAELSLSSAKAALEPLQRALASVKADSTSGRIAVRAPVSGTVVEVAAANGKGVQAGAPILRIINTGTLWLKANLPASEAGKATQTAGATFTVTGLEGEFRPSRLVTVNDMLDPQTRTLSILFEVPNPKGRLKVGMFADVSIRTGAAPNALAVPKDALVEDEGRWFLFVQTAAETFERREVKVGAKDQGMVQIVEGLKDHERVVVKGAYYVKIAATAGKAADPHAGHNH